MSRILVPAMLVLWLLGAVGCNEPSRPHVILIVLDTVRKDHLGCYGHERPTSPNIDRFAAGATLYERAVAAAPWTLPSHASLFTGLWPSNHLAHHENPSLDPSRTTLAERLADVGYETVGFCNNPWITGRLGMTQGFDGYTEIWRERVSRDGFGLNVFIDPELHGMQDAGAARLLAGVREWIDGRDASRPFFLFINVIEAHGFYDPPQDYRNRFTDGRLTREQVKQANLDFFRGAYSGRLETRTADRARALYDGEIAYVDEWFGRLVALLTEHDALDDSIVILTSDHGEGFGEHELFGLPLVDHQLSLHREVLDVPLVIRYPRGTEEPPRGTRVRDVASAIDIVPTVLDVVGIETDDALDGINLRGEPAGASRPVISEYYRPLLHRGLLDTAIRDKQVISAMVNRRLVAVQTRDLKIILSSDGDSLVYDVADDALERTPLGAAGTENARALARLASERLASMEAGPKTAPPALSDAQREALEALGYLK